MGALRNAKYRTAREVHMNWALIKVRKNIWSLKFEGGLPHVRRDTATCRMTLPRNKQPLHINYTQQPKSVSQRGYHVALSPQKNVTTLVIFFQRQIDSIHKIIYFNVKLWLSWYYLIRKINFNIHILSWKLNNLCIVN